MKVPLVVVKEQREQRKLREEQREVLEHGPGAIRLLNEQLQDSSLPSKMTKDLLKFRSLCVVIELRNHKTTTADDTDDPLSGSRATVDPIGCKQTEC
jgi:hypothetical protein